MGRRLLTLLLLMLALAGLPGCGAARRPEPTLAVSAEQRGSSLVISIRTTNFAVGKDGHAHVRLNGGSEAMIYASTYTVPDVKPGVYQIEVQLSNQKHENLDVKQTFYYEVK